MCPATCLCVRERAETENSECAMWKFERDVIRPSSARHVPRSPRAPHKSHIPRFARPDAPTHHNAQGNSQHSTWDAVGMCGGPVGTITDVKLSPQHLHHILGHVVVRRRPRYPRGPVGAE